MLLPKTWNLLIVAVAVVVVTYIIASANTTTTPRDTRDVVFNVGDTEMLRLALNGDFLVKGKLVTNDVEVYTAFKNWMATQQQVAATPRPAAPTVAPKIPVTKKQG